MEGTPSKAVDIVPNLSVSDSAAAVEFYKQAFGAIELFRVESDRGEVFAELSIDGARIFVADESHPHNNVSPDALSGTTVRIDLLSDDPDAMQARPVGAGADEMQPVRDEEVGPRMGRIRDPFGHTWLIGKHWTGARRSG
jgi:PhnB protein